MTDRKDTHDFFADFDLSTKLQVLDVNYLDMLRATLNYRLPVGVGEPSTIGNGDHTIVEADPAPSNGKPSPTSSWSASVTSNVGRVVFKNDCPSGYRDDVGVFYQPRTTVTFTSDISMDDAITTATHLADELANDAIEQNGQAYANTYGKCVLIPKGPNPKPKPSGNDGGSPSGSGGGSSDTSSTSDDTPTLNPIKPVPAFDEDMFLWVLFRGYAHNGAALANVIKYDYEIQVNGGYTDPYALYKPFKTKYTPSAFKSSGYPILYKGTDYMWSKEGHSSDLKDAINRTVDYLFRVVKQNYHGWVDYHNSNNTGLIIPKMEDRPLITILSRDEVVYQNYKQIYDPSIEVINPYNHNVVAIPEAKYEFLDNESELDALLHSAYVLDKKKVIDDYQHSILEGGFNKLKNGVFTYNSKLSTDSLDQITIPHDLVESSYLFTVCVGGLIKAVVPQPTTFEEYFDINKRTALYAHRSAGPIWCDVGFSAGSNRDNLGHLESSPYDRFGLAIDICNVVFSLIKDSSWTDWVNNFHSVEV